MDHPIPLIDRQLIQGDHIIVAMVKLHKGCKVKTHDHVSEQFAYVVSGKTLFGVGAEGSPERYEVIVEGGQMIHFPSHVPHSADALEDTIILDMLSPKGDGMGVDRQGAH